MKNAFICYYTDGYALGVKALKKSHEVWQHQAPLLIRKVSSRNEALLGRWTEANETKEFDNVCILDADMFFCNNTDKYFRLADAGLIGAAHNNAFHGFDGIPLHHNPITNVPLFIKAGHPLIKDVLRLWIDGGCRCDFEACNRSIPKHLDTLFVFPSHLWTNIHCSMLKPETAVKWRYERMMSLQEEAVNMVHGKWWQKKYHEWLLKDISKYYNGDERCISIARQSVELIVREFNKYCTD